MNEAKVVAGKLLEVNAVKLQPRQPFTWASGWKSPIYCDNRRLLSFPELRDVVKNGLCKLVTSHFEQATLVAGVATAGIPWGTLVADLLQLPFIYVRGQAKGHGLGNRIEGRYSSGEKVVVVEDLVSTGKSSLEAVDALLSAKMEVVGMVSVFTYAFTVAQQAFDARGLKLFSLTNYPVLVDLARENGTIRAEDEAHLLKWREDPAGWGGFAA